MAKKGRGGRKAAEGSGDGEASAVGSGEEDQRLSCNKHYDQCHGCDLKFTDPESSAEP